MDSPSQPVNNHHVHSHTAAESKYTRLRYRLPPERTKCWFWAGSGLVLGWFWADSGLVLGWFWAGSGRHCRVTSLSHCVHLQFTSFVRNKCADPHRFFTSVAPDSAPTSKCDWTSDLCCFL